jgi:hypothetical protein
MLNKYNAALLATVVYGILFPLIYHCVTQNHLPPIAVAASAVVFFFGMLAAFGKLMDRRSGRHG